MGEDVDPAIALLPVAEANWKRGRNQSTEIDDLSSRLNEVELWIDRVPYVKGAEAIYAPLRERRNYLRARLTELRTPPE